MRYWSYVEELHTVGVSNIYTPQSIGWLIFPIYPYFVTTMITPYLKLYNMSINITIIMVGSQLVCHSQTRFQSIYRGYL